MIRTIRLGLVTGIVVSALAVALLHALPDQSLPLEWAGPNAVTAVALDQQPAATPGAVVADR